ncbi:MAG: hypothetical protein LBH81_02340 [Rickettsiales bacterium]|jgi:hypothetical protein|nr:hypothetical protein [Rickettsiales bacterium]
MKKLLLIIALLLFVIPRQGEAATGEPRPTSDNFEMTELTDRARHNILLGLRNSVPNAASLETKGVPLDIRAGLLVVEGLSTVAMLIYKNLIDVIIWLLFIFFAFWWGLEAWSVVYAKSKISDTVKKAVKKGIIITVAVFVLKSNPAEWFMILMSAVARVGNYAADLFLTEATGMGISQSCAAVHAMVVAGGNSFGFLGPENVASVLCMTGRITEFFWTALSQSFALIGTGIGTNVALAVLGVAGVALFLWCAVKFTIMTLGVVVDMTLMLMFLPFVAFKESFKDGWSKDAPFASAIFERIANSFGGGDISGQIKKLVQVLIYIIAVALISSICYLLMKGILAENGNSMVYTLLGGALCAYLISQTDKIATQMGGAVDKEWTGKIQENVNSLAAAAKKYGGNIWTMIRK